MSSAGGRLTVDTEVNAEQLLSAVKTLTVEARSQWVEGAVSLPNRGPKMRNLEREKQLYRSNSAAPWQIVFKFHQMVLCGSRNSCGIVKTH